MSARQENSHSQLYGLIIVRPEGQGENLAMRVNSCGGRTWVIPSIRIQPIDLDPDWVKAQLPGKKWIIFVSVNAVEQGWPRLVCLPETAQLAAIGQATARRLEALSGRTVHFPDTGSDSEALLAMPVMQAVAGQQILIVRGRGGREQLKATLEARGAEVAYLECYERRLPPTIDTNQLDEALCAGSAVSVMSAEALKNLWQLAGPDRSLRLSGCPFIVPHHRVAEAARQLGITDIHLTGPGNEAIVALWNQLNSQRHD